MDKQALIDALRNTAQSASNAIAENVSVPVDMINAGLQKIGINKNVNAPFGGSEWMAQNGFTRPVDASPQSIVGATLGNLSPVAFSKAPQLAEALLKVGKEGLPVGLSTKAVGGMDFLKPEIVEKGNYLASKTPYGEVGGTIGEVSNFSEKPFLKIHHAELENEMRGKGLGKKMYQSLIDDAHNRGLNVFSDFTVETPAVNVYEALKRAGYDVKNNVAGSIDGGVYGAGANSPAFQVMPKVK